MSDRDAVVVAYDLVSAFGTGAAVCVDGLYAGRSAIARCGRFDTARFRSPFAAQVDGLDCSHEESILIQMLRRLQTASIPRDALPILATTVGEIDLLERGEERCTLTDTLDRVRALLGLNERGVVVSAACASTCAAISRSVSLIRCGVRDAVVVIAVDIVSEFVFSGFSALMALADDRARPFDRDRCGLTAGEAAGYVVLMSAGRARRERRDILACIRGCGQSSDANHMTGPSRDGGGLARAVRRSLDSAGLSAADIGFIAAHGTGTTYNDAMELKAFKQVFESARPVFSVKGALGHTMGSAGLVQLVAAIAALERQAVPPTVGLRQVDDDARGWAGDSDQTFEGSSAMVVNAGFGGINAAVVVSV